MLGAYDDTPEFVTPNLDRFAARATRFTNHYTGSLPCMPARHDILCGALDFLWKPWGSVELWEDPITVPLHDAGVTTMLISDHPHLFESGGENYHVDFTAWGYERGHESDAWKTRPDPSWVGAPTFGREMSNYDNSRGWFRGESDFPGPRTMRAAAQWIDENGGINPATDERWHDRFLLFVDEFDPHEPFDTPEPYASMYDPEWDGPHLIWPPYTKAALRNGVLTPDQANQIRAQYGGKLTMIDRWFGEIVAALERQGLWDSTMVIVVTDHGHYLGEHDAFGKPPLPIYQTLGHIPLLVWWPGAEPADCDALTTAVDVFATLADVFGVGDAVRQRTHGRSLVPVLRGESTRVRDAVLTGVWGREVHYIDGHHKYARAPVGDNGPISMWSNRWTTMPTHVLPKDMALPLPDERAVLDHMPGSTVPVIRQRWNASDPLPFWAWGGFRGHHLWDLDDDPGEERDLAKDDATKFEAELIEALRAELESLDAPSEQFERLGLLRRR
ncbi:MAG: sulfatase [Actinobacteria bacterium]|nr:sulfatase [Actinomycetota bacterium]